MRHQNARRRHGHAVSGKAEQQPEAQQVAQQLQHGLLMRCNMIRVNSMRRMRWLHWRPSRLPDVDEYPLAGSVGLILNPVFVANAPSAFCPIRRESIVLVIYDLKQPGEITDRNRVRCTANGNHS
jgi:tRNA G37 N-methylase TrmD